MFRFKLYVSSHNIQAAVWRSVSRNSHSSSDPQSVALYFRPWLPSVRGRIDVIVHNHGGWPVTVVKADIVPTHCHCHRTFPTWVRQDQSIYSGTNESRRATFVITWHSDCFGCCSQSWRQRSLPAVVVALLYTVSEYVLRVIAGRSKIHCIQKCTPKILAREFTWMYIVCLCVCMRGCLWGVCGYLCVLRLCACAWVC